MTSKLVPAPSWLRHRIGTVRWRRTHLLTVPTFVLALVTTQLWFPQRYWHLVALDAGPTWTLVARDVLLVALTVVLAVATGSGRERARSW